MSLLLCCPEITSLKQKKLNCGKERKDLVVFFLNNILFLFFWLFFEK